MKENKERVSLFLAANSDESSVANLVNYSAFCSEDYLAGCWDHHLVAR